MVGESGLFLKIEGKRDDLLILSRQQLRLEEWPMEWRANGQGRLYSSVSIEAF